MGGTVYFLSRAACAHIAAPAQAAFDMSQQPPEPDDLTVSLRPFHLQAGVLAGGRAYLLVIEGSSSATFDLPTTGEVIIGRSQDAQLRLEDNSASRRHARLVLTSRDAVL